LSRASLGFQSLLAGTTGTCHHAQLSWWDVVLLTFCLDWPQTFNLPNFYLPRGGLEAQATVPGHKAPFLIMLVIEILGFMFVYTILHKYHLWTCTTHIKIIFCGCCSFALKTILKILGTKWHFSLTDLPCCKQSGKLKPGIVQFTDKRSSNSAFPYVAMFVSTTGFSKLVI
jgi:hypothetical protein